MPGWPDRSVTELAVAGQDADELLVARGHLFANPTRTRLELVDVAAAPRVLLRGCLELTAIPELMARLPGAWLGGTAEGGHWWAEDVDELRIWDRVGLRWTRDPLLRRTEPARVFAAGEVERVEAFHGDDWVEQGVVLHTRAGARVVLVSIQNLSVVHAFDYDGIELDWDMSWCRRLASEVATRVLPSDELG